jgi:Cu+-exporting ATPase
MAKAATLGIGQGLKRPLVQVDDFASEVGSGVKCSVNGVSVYIGNRRGLDKNNIDISEGTFEAMEKAERRGQTAVVIAVNGRTEAVLGFIDKAKDDACLVMSILQHAFGIKVYMLTGDNYRTARIIAGKIGIPIENIVADLLPDQKVAFIQRLQKQNEKVAMIGTLKRV